MIAGTCLCGAVRYELDVTVDDITHCHCRTCRKQHGAPFASFAEVAPGDLRFVAGDRGLSTFQATAAYPRRFCAICGAVAPSLVGGRWLVPMGNLLGEMTPARGRHVCVADKAPWHVIADSWPQHPGAPPDWPCQVSGTVSTSPSASSSGETLGSCCCGDVAFAVAGAPARWMQCHCSRCRRARSAAHGSNTFYPLAQFAWRGGQDQIRKFMPPDAKRFAVAFCTRCGGGVPVERDQVPFVLVPAALLEPGPGPRPEAHIHVASKAPWYSFQDELPQFSELPA